MDGHYLFSYTIDTQVNDYNPINLLLSLFSCPIFD